MDRNSVRMVVAGAILGWIGVGAYGVWQIADQESGEGWERPYLMFAVALILATALTLVAGWKASCDSARPMLRRFGIGVGALALASALTVAWALPLWMTLIAVSLAMFAVAAPRDLRPTLGVVVAAQIAGMAAMYVAVIAEVGRQDSYGDYPAAFGVGLVVTAAVSALGLATFARAGSTIRTLATP